MESLDPEEMKKIEAFQRMADSVKFLLRESTKDFSTLEAILGMLYILLQGAFLAHHNDVETYKHINQIIARAKKSADLQRETHDRETN